jgi:hypothetical protein
VLLKHGIIESLKGFLKNAFPTAVHLSALGCLYQVCKDNVESSARAISTRGLAPSLVTLLLRMNPQETQLAAAKVVSVWHNVGVLKVGVDSLD